MLIKPQNSAGESDLGFGKLFTGTSIECKRFLARQKVHYVYVLRRPDGRPFYVGKGVGPRAFHHENEARHPNNRTSNSHKLNVIRSIWKAGKSITYEIDLVTDNPAVAFERETQLIGLLKRLHEGGPPTNRAAGGGSSAGAAPVSKLRHSTTLAGTPKDNPERATLNLFVLGIAQMKSVVVKPAGQFIARPTIKFPNATRAFSIRQAAAIAASAAANGVLLDGACRIPRRMYVDGVEGLVENGVACDLLTSGAVSIDSATFPADECFVLSPIQARAVIGLIGVQKAIDLGIVHA